MGPEPPSSGLARLADTPDVVGLVYGFQLVQLGQSPVTPGEPGSERPQGEHRPHVLDPLSILGMQFLRGEQGRPRCLPKAGARVVLEYGWVPEHRELGSHGRA